MKKAIAAFAVGVIGLTGTVLYGASSSAAALVIVPGLEGTEAVGIIVKNGTKMDTILADNFVLSQIPCDEAATSTPSEMCPVTLFEGRPVEVFYTADDNMTGKQSFNTKLSGFPFAGRIEYVNRAQADIEPRLIQYMLESGNNRYTIIYEP